MKALPVLRIFVSLLFTLAVLFTVSVKEVHYLFVAHHLLHQEKCENHLHGEEGHNDCVVCKIEVSPFTEHFGQPLFSAIRVRLPEIPDTYQSVILYASITSSPLRGPPALV